MRWIGVPCALVSCALVSSCSFQAPNGSSPDASGGGDGPAGMDASGDGMPPDGPPASPVRTRRIDITDAQVAGGPHTDFPLLVSITQPWLRGKAAGGGIAHAMGFDIGFFADAAGTMRLAHEVEVYRSDANMGTLVAWVKVPSLAATSELFVRYGDPAITASQESAAMVWSNGFSGVWHLGSLGDATGNSTTVVNSGSTGMAARIGDGRSFDGNNDYIDVGSGNAIDDAFTGGGTIEAWFRATGWGEDNRGRIMEKAATTATTFSGWSLSVDNGNVTGSILFAHGTTDAGDPLGAWNAPANAVALNAWTHVAVVYDQGSSANNPSIYINGASVAVTELVSPSGNMDSDSPYNGRIGNRTNGDRTFNGLLDEVRLSTAPRSAGWITTSFRNQSDPAAFYSVGPEL